MAVLNKIRQRSFFLIIVIALALFAFILADLFRSGGFGGGDKAQKTIGSVNGEDIKTSEFQNLVDNSGRGQQSMQVVRNVWSQQVNSLLVGQRVELAGIRAESEHINAGLAQNLASNPTFQGEDGQFDLGKLQEFVATMKDNEPARYQNTWIPLETSTAKQAAQNIYFDMVKAGVAATHKEGELSYKMENDKVNFQYVQLPYTSIADSTVVVSKSDISNYISANQSQFKKGALASIEYVKIDEVATEEDEEAISNELKALLSDKKEFNNVTKQTENVLGFANTTNIEEFVNENSSEKFDSKFKFKSDLKESLNAFLFDQEIGTVYGPYKDGNTFKISKLVAKTKMPDSVRASHILVSWDGLRTADAENPRTKQEAKKLADSIKGVVINSKKAFVELAAKYSADKSNSDNGGDLDYFTPGRMVPAFNDYAFQNKTGDIGVVETQFGYHIIKIVDQKNLQSAVQIATITRNIEPSEKTINEIYSQSTKFLIGSRADGFAETAKASNLLVKPVSEMNELDENIPSLGKQRSVVRWAFNEETKVGAIKSFDLPSGYVIAKLTEKAPEGLMSTEDASSKVLPILRNKKKAELLIAKVEGTDLNAIAKANSATVKTATAVTMKNSTISGAGIEKKVVGTAFALDINQVSKPVAGTKGVYVLKTLAKTPGQGLAAYQGIANKLTENLVRKAQSGVTNALKENAEIEDKRAELY